MNIDSMQKQLEKEQASIQTKFKFVTELQTLLKKHGQSAEDLLELLNEMGTAAPARKPAAAGKKSNAGRKTKAKAASTTKAATAKKPRKKQEPRPMRKFKNPQTGETVESRAPHLDKKIKSWSEEMKVDWRTLEV